MSTDRVLAAPPGDCCLKAVLHEGEPAGHAETVFNINTYITGSKETGARRILLYFADVWGPFFVNGQLVADYFASRGEAALRI
jgi:hypothetical protein